MPLEVELRNRFIRETFGRYLTDQVVDSPVGIAGGTEDGIGGSHKLSLLHSHDALAPLKSPIPVRCSIVEGGRIDDEVINGALTKLSLKRAELRLDKTVHALADLKMQIVGDTVREILEPAYCKVEAALPGSGGLPSRHSPLMHGVSKDRADIADIDATG